MSQSNWALVNGNAKKPDAAPVPPPQAHPTHDALRPPLAAFTIKQASSYSGLSRSFIYGLFEAGQLPRLKAGKRVLILKVDLDAYLLKLREAAG